MKPKSLSDYFVSLFRFYGAQHSSHSIAFLSLCLTAQTIVYGSAYSKKLLGCKGREL